MIRADIVAARSKIAADLEALRFKADVPARLGDSLANVAMAVTERVLDQIALRSEQPIEDRDAER